MKISKKGFSIIEAIVSTIILTIWVFWIYKLIWNNMNLLSNNETYITMLTLWKNFKECSKYFWYNNLSSYSSWDLFSVNFWVDNNWCFTWSYDNDFYFSWVTFDNKEFFLYWKIIEKETDYLKVNYNVFNFTAWKLFKEGNYNDNLQNVIIK